MLRIRIRVFGPGSFHHQANLVRKALISTVLWPIYDFLSLNNDVNVPSKISKKTGSGSRSVHLTNGSVWIQAQKHTVPRTRIRNTVVNTTNMKNGYRFFLIFNLLSVAGKALIIIARIDWWHQFRRQREKAGFFVLFCQRYRIGSGSLYHQVKIVR